MSNPAPPVKPWIVTHMRKAGTAAGYYPWHVHLENHYFLPHEPGFRCSWQVDLKDERFDLSLAVQS